YWCSLPYRRQRYCLNHIHPDVQRRRSAVACGVPVLGQWGKACKEHQRDQQHVSTVLLTRALIPNYQPCFMPRGTIVSSAVLWAHFWETMRHLRKPYSGQKAKTRGTLKRWLIWGKRLPGGSCADADPFATGVTICKRRRRSRGRLRSTFQMAW